MKLDRNINSNGRGKYGKYGLIKNREFKAYLLKANDGQDGVKAAAEVVKAIVTLEKAGIIDWGDTPETEFFAIRLKDKYASKALLGYAYACIHDDIEYSRDVFRLSLRSGLSHPNCKRPD